MITIAEVSCQLRQAADILDGLLGLDPSKISLNGHGSFRPKKKHGPYKKSNETPATAKKILKAMKAKRGRKKGQIYANGTHWTHTPEGKKRLRRISRKVWKKRKAEQ